MNGWLVQDNILLRERQTGLYEIAALQSSIVDQQSINSVDLAYLLTAPPISGASGDLELITGVDTALEMYSDQDGIYLLNADGNGIFIGQAMAIDANGNSIAVAVQSSIVNQQSSISLVVPGDWLAQAAYPVLIDPLLVKAVSSQPIAKNWQYSYDGLGRLAEACPNGSAANCADGKKFAYTYDSAGNLVSFDR